MRHMVGMSRLVIDLLCCIHSALLEIFAETCNLPTADFPLSWSLPVLWSSDSEKEATELVTQVTTLWRHTKFLASWGADDSPVWARCQSCGRWSLVYKTTRNFSKLARHFHLCAILAGLLLSQACPAENYQVCLHQKDLLAPTIKKTTKGFGGVN